jgi:hypothetical protein
MMNTYHYNNSIPVEEFRHDVISPGFEGNLLRVNMEGQLQLEIQGFSKYAFQRRRDRLDGLERLV